jgi:Delta3-Delta2-enoyl-CoA isomerase
MKQLKSFPEGPSSQVTVSSQESNDYCIYLLKMSHGENSFGETFVEKLLAALDFITRNIQDRKPKLPSALITTGTDKYYSTGLDLNYLSKAKRPHDFMTTLYYPLLQKFLGLEMPTIALLNGHAYAGGMVLALAHDFRIMRVDRGFMCMNEVLLPSAIPAGMMSILKHKFGTGNLLRDIVLTAKRFSPKEALDNGLVDGIAEQSNLMDEALKMATNLVKFNTFTFGTIKKELNKEAINSLEYREHPELFYMFSKL